MLDRWQEILEGLSRHKLRTSLTALSVAWGIFMLVVLLGAGSGLQNQIEHDFRDDALNSVWVRPGKTGVAYEGYRVGRRITYDNDDVAAITSQIDPVEHITGRVYVRGSAVVRYRDRTSNFSTRAVHPGHLHLENTSITAGRFLNDLDLQRRRKVTVIGRKVADYLFGRADPLGQRISVGEVQFLVVGVFDDNGGESEQRVIYVPITTAQVAYGRGEAVDQIMFTLGETTAAEALRTAEQTRRLLAARKHFSPSDMQAARVSTPIEEVNRIRGMFTAIRIFVWVVGIGTIIAGIVGVSNIMMISVRERTKEIGVRKALGATPWSIVSTIVQEALLLTGLAGYAGLLAGVGLLELVDRLLPNNEYLRDPQVDLGIALTATIVLVLSGVLAGLFPAIRAARVQPVVALRDA